MCAHQCVASMHTIMVLWRRTCANLCLSLPRSCAYFAVLTVAAYVQTRWFSVINHFPYIKHVNIHICRWLSITKGFV